MRQERNRFANFTRALAGVFVVWQLVFMLAANLVGVFKGVPPEMVRYEFADGAWRDSLDRTAALPKATSEPAARSRGILWATDRWGEVTGQWQGWAMFAPNVPTSSYFLTTTLRWNEAGADRVSQQIELPSPFEPIEPQRYWMPALTSARRFNFEWRLTLAIEICRAREQAQQSGGETAKFDDQWRQWMARQAEPLRAYARVRHHEWLAEHPAMRPADEVILSVGEYRRDLLSDAVAWKEAPRCVLLRWRPRPAIALQPAVLELEIYEVSSGEFVPLMVGDVASLARRGS
jgi:hypothetical protein